MSDADKIYYAKFPGRTDETPFGISPGRYSSQIKPMLERILREAGITTSRREPQTCKVEVSTDEIISRRGTPARLSRLHVGTYDIMPPLARMTGDEFIAEQAELLTDIPPEFHSAMAFMAYDRGHSAGNEEIISELRSLVGGLRDAIKAYGDRLAAAYKQNA